MFNTKDVLELFRLERRTSFQRFVELLLTHSGGMFEATRYTRPCDVSRTTIANYLAVLEATHVAHVIRPYSTRRAAEIVAAPKVYGFDTGFVCYFRSWSTLRAEDHGILWEHFVLNEMQARVPIREIDYWRDKRRHEVDFVLTARRGAPIAVECKWRSGEVDPTGLLAFNAAYPQSELLVVAPDVTRTLTRRRDGIEYKVLPLEGLIERVNGR